MTLLYQYLSYFSIAVIKHLDQFKQLEEDRVYSTSRLGFFTERSQGGTQVGTGGRVEAETMEGMWPLP